MKTFSIAGKSIRGFIKDGELWLVASDVTDCLGFCSKNLKRDLRDDQQGSAVVETKRGFRKMKTISSGGLLSLILRSRHNEDNLTKDWAFSLFAPYLKLRLLEVGAS